MYQGCTVTKTPHLPIRYFLALLWAHPILHISRIRVKNRGRGKSFLFSKNRPYHVWGPRRLLFNVHWVYFPEIRRAERERDHWPASSAEVKNTYSYEFRDVIRADIPLPNFENFPPDWRLWSKQFSNKSLYRDAANGRNLFLKMQFSWQNYCAVISHYLRRKNWHTFLFCLLMPCGLVRNVNRVNDARTQDKVNLRCRN